MAPQRRSPGHLYGGDGADLLLGQGGNDGWCANRTCVVGVDILEFHYGPDRGDSPLALPQLEGGPGVDRLDGGPGNDRLDGGPENIPAGSTSLDGLNNVLYGGAGNDFCSYGPLTGSEFQGTDRGDIRDPSCEWPSTGMSTRVVLSSTSPTGYKFVVVTIDEATEFKW